MIEGSGDGRAEQAGEPAGERGLAAATPAVDEHQRRHPDEREQLGVVDGPPRAEVRLLRVQVHQPRTRCSNSSR